MIRLQTIRIAALVFGIHASILTGAPAQDRMEPEEPAESADAPSPTTDLTVEVTSDHGGVTQPIGCATVAVRTSENLDEARTTDEAGRAVFTGLPRGSLKLSVSASGMSADVSQVELTQDRQSVRISLTPLVGRLTIKIIGVDGTETLPVAGARIKVTPGHGEPRSLPPTDEQGVVTTENILFGEMTITVLATGWDTARVPFQLDGEDAELEIRLSKQVPPE